MRRDRALERLRRRVVRVPEGHERRQRSIGERREFGIHQRLVRARGAPHGLRRIVDEDVERAARGDVFGQSQDLRRVAQVDPDDLEPVQPVGGVRKAREPADGVAGKTRRDRGVGTVAEQAQRDVHADLRAAPGEQRPLAGEVGARFALAVAHRRAVRAELVVERVDQRVRLLADITGAGLQQGAGRRRGRGRRDRDTPGLIVDAIGSPRGGRGDHRAVGLGNERAGFTASRDFYGLEHLPRRLSDGNEIRVLVVDGIQLGEHAQGCFEVGGIQTAGRQIGGRSGLVHTQFSHGSAWTSARRC